MRFNPEEFWDEVLYLVPKGAELFDSDATPYYIDYGDGTPLSETYLHYAPHDVDTYQTEEPYEDSAAFVEEAMRERKKEMLASQKKVDPNSMLERIKAGMKKVHKR